MREIIQIGEVQPTRALRSNMTKVFLDGWNRADLADPYWDPCLSYQRNWAQALAAAKISPRAITGVIQATTSSSWN